MSGEEDPMDVPTWLLTGFKFNESNSGDLITRGRLDGLTASTLSKQQIKTQVGLYEKGLEDAEKAYQGAGRRPGDARGGVFSLTSSAIRSTVTALSSSPNIAEETATVAKSLSASVIREIVCDPRTPYHVIRAFQSLPPNLGPSKPSETAKAAINLDEAVLANERYIRNRGPERNKDGAGLLKLEHLDLLFGKIDGECRKIIRKDPPKGGMEIFDAARQRSIEIQSDAASFISTFDRITGNILKGLDWSNIFIAGGSILTALLHVDSSKDGEAKVIEPDLDVYIYGLDSKAANEKMEHLFQIWSQNLPAENKQKCVVKNAKTINFLADYPNRRIQIVLKLVSCPTSVLLNFDLDACAVGFDGKEVLMLPRFARALETGYNVFTMDLIWGHHLGDRRASQELRIFKYATRGFGIRILPIYVRSLDDGVDEAYEKLQMWNNDPCDRIPNGPEPPLKTLKRIEYIARDTVERYSFGPTAMSGKPEWDDVTDEEWAETIEQAIEEKEMEMRERIKLLEEGQRERVIPLDIAALDGIKQHRAIPGFRRTIACLELWLRHCEAWRLDLEGQARFDWSSLVSDIYDPEGYSDLPKYTWSKDEPFNQEAFQEKIDELNKSLRYEPERRLEAQPGQGHQNPEIKRQIYGPDLKSVIDKPITLAINLPIELEDFLQETITDALSKKGFEVKGKDVISPWREPAESGAHGQTDEEGDFGGNIRVWKIDKRLMWAGIDRSIDECFEVLWAFFHFLCEVNIDLRDTETVHYLAHKYRARIPPSLPNPKREESDEGEKLKESRPVLVNEPSKSDTLPDQEKWMFAYWALRWPSIIERNYVEPPSIHYTEIDECRYPPQDELFWREGDEGDPSGHDNDWFSVSVEEDAERRKAKNFLVSQGLPKKRKATSVSSMED